MIGKLFIHIKKLGWGNFWLVILTKVSKKVKDKKEDLMIIHKADFKLFTLIN